MPTEAEKFEGRAQFAFGHAKLPADYLDAAREYEKAIAAAPWVAGYYADLCTIYEKAENYTEAKKSCEFFLASSPSAQDASDVRKRIAGLEFAIEKANAPLLRAAKEREQQDAYLRSIDGARFVHIVDSPECTTKYVSKIRGRVLTVTSHLLNIDRRKYSSCDDMSQPGQSQTILTAEFKEGIFLAKCENNSMCVEYAISPNGQSLLGRSFFTLMSGDSKYFLYNLLMKRN